MSYMKRNLNLIITKMFDKSQQGKSKVRRQFGRNSLVNSPQSPMGKNYKDVQNRPKA